MNYLRHKHDPPWMRRLPTGSCCDSCAGGGPCATGATEFRGGHLLILGMVAFGIYWGMRK